MKIILSVPSVALGGIPMWPTHNVIQIIGVSDGKGGKRIICGVYAMTQKKKCREEGGGNDDN